MPKSAIINLAREGSLETIPLKQLTLLFDNLQVEAMTLHMAMHDIERANHLTENEKQIFLAEIHWLQEQGIIKTYHFSRAELSEAKFSDPLILDIQSTGRTVHQNVIPLENTGKSTGAPNNRSNKLQLAGVLKADNNLIGKMEDIRLRIDATVLAGKDPMREFIPLVNSFASYHEPHPSTQPLISF